MSKFLKFFHVIVIIAIVIPQAMGAAYTTPGTYSVLIPVNTDQVVVSMWGAGGAGISLQGIPSSNAIMYPGGSGAYVSCTINASPGSTITLIVGGGGAVAGFAQTTTNAIGGGGRSLF